MELKIIARVRSPMPDKFGLPRQSGIIPALRGTIVFEPPYRDSAALRGLEACSHVWVIWGFDREFASRRENGRERFSPTVRPPKLGGNRREGVFATRSPNRPNPIGLSALKIEGFRDTGEGTVIDVSGLDMADGTPVYDVKPYIPMYDSIPEASPGISVPELFPLSVSDPDGLLSSLPEDEAAAVRDIMASDPRPGYSGNDDRTYTFSFGDREISFTVTERTASVTDITKKEHQNGKNE